MKKQEIKLICNRCGKEKEIDEEKSNKQWKVYKDFKKRCKCGGVFKFKLVNKEE